MSADLTRTVLYRAPVDLTTLSAIRHAVAACLATVGLSRDRIDDVVIAVGEIAGNAVEHGGGTGDVQVSHDDRFVHCLITDEGPGLPPELRGYRPDGVPPTAVDGRGLWLAFTLCSDVSLRSSRHGTQVDLIIDLPPRDPRPAREDMVG